MALINRLSVALAVNPTGFTSGLEKAVQSLKNFTGQFKGIAIAGAGILGGAIGVGIGRLATGFFEVNKRAQETKSTLNNLFGGRAGGTDAFNTIAAFAATTPFAMQKVAEAFIALKTFGIEPTLETMSGLGKVAAGLGTPLGKLTKAVTNASTGSFSALEKLGFDFVKKGEFIEVTFQGVTETIGNNTEAIVGFLTRMGNNKFDTAMTEKMLNIETGAQKLRDAIEFLQISLGEESGLNKAIAESTRLMALWLQEAISPSRVKSFFDFFTSLASGIGDLITFVTDSLGAFFVVLHDLFQVLTGGPIKGILGTTGTSQLIDAGRLFGNGFTEAVSPLELGLINPDTRFEELQKLQAAALEEQKKSNDLLNKIQQKKGGAVAQ